MPQYAFKCEKCPNEITLLLKMGDCPETTECPECKDVMKRVWTFGGFQLNGGGWHGVEYNEYGPNS